MAARKPLAEGMWMSGRCFWFPFVQTSIQKDGFLSLVVSGVTKAADMKATLPMRMIVPLTTRRQCITRMKR